MSDGKGNLDTVTHNAVADILGHGVPLHEQQEPADQVKVPTVEPTPSEKLPAGSLGAPEEPVTGLVELNDHQQAALRQFRELHGGTWQNKLKAAWESGEYGKIDENLRMALEQVKELVGPDQLSSVKIAEEPAKETTPLGQLEYETRRGRGVGGARMVGESVEGDAGEATEIMLTRTPDGTTDVSIRVDDEEKPAVAPVTPEEPVLFGPEIEPPEELELEPEESVTDEIVELALTQGVEAALQKMTAAGAVSEEVNQDEVFKYLDELRKSGVTNMFGAGEYIEKKFGVDSAEARSLLAKWMETFGQRNPEERRRRPFSERHRRVLNRRTRLRRRK